MKKYVQQAYDNCVFIVNNGHAYEFYKNVKRRPTKIVMAFDKHDREWSIEQNRKFMERADFNELWELIKRDKKPYSMGLIAVDKNIRVGAYEAYAEALKLLKENKAYWLNYK